MSDERIDHVSDAMACLIAADGHLSAEMPHETGEYKADVIAVAQVYATLAVAEQLRVMNEILSMTKQQRVIAAALRAGGES